MKEKILKILLEADDFVSGQKLCEELQVSRTAVWKAIRRLQEDGYRIEAATNKGYRLTHSSEADVLGQVELERALEPLSWAGHPVIFKAQTGFSPHAYVVAMRINRAKALLRETSLSVEEIGTSVGFSSLAYFSAAFLKRAGISPSSWRVSKI